MSDTSSLHVDAMRRDFPPILNESTKYFMATIALNFGTVLAYGFGVLLASYLLGANFGLAFHIALAVFGLHLIVYSLLKTAPTVTDSYLRFMIALLLLGYATWMIFISVGYKDDIPAFLSAVVILMIATALAGWRYRWLHPRAP